MSNLVLKRRPLRILMGVFLAAVTLALLISRNLEDPDLQTAVLSALAADDRLLEVALKQYPEQGPAIVITYGQLPLFREQLARFGPQVVPIVAAYQTSFTTADVLQIGRKAWQALRDLLASWHIHVWPLVASAASVRELPGEAAETNEEQTAPENHAAELGRLSPEDRGLIALLNMSEEGNAFVGQWEISQDRRAERIPSRLVTLAGPEILFSGLTGLERRIFQGKEIDWPTYRDAIVDAAVIASGVAVLRFLKPSPRGIRPAAPSTARAAADLGKVLGVNAMRFGVPIGLGALTVLHPSVFSHYLWILAESFGLPGILGPIVGWAIVIVPLAFLLSWMLLSVRALGFAGRVFAGGAWGCHWLAGRLAAASAQRSS